MSAAIERNMKMKRLNEVVESITASIVLIFCAGCGTQDYGEDVTPKASAALVTAQWRDQALSKKHDDVSVILGNSVKIPEGSHWIRNDSCPADSVCFRGAYFGEEQLAKLSLQYPAFVSLLGGVKTRSYLIRSIPHLVIDADLVEIGEKLTIRFCGASVGILASEVSGGGRIDASGGEECGLEKRDGADISIVTGTLLNFSTISNGVNGADGIDGKINWKPARDGDASSVKVSAKVEFEAIRICIDEGGCQSEVPVTGFGTGEAAMEKRTRSVKKLLDTNRTFFSTLGGDLADLDSIVKEIRRPVEGSFFLGCFFESVPKTDGGTGIVSLVAPRLTGVEALNGEDGKFSSLGTPGESGGNAGDIRLVGNEITPSEVEAKPGKAGKVGKSFIREPGRGVPSGRKEYRLNYEVRGFVACQTGVKLPVKAITFKVEQGVEVGKQVEFLKTGLASKVISESEVRGRDGLRVEVKEAVEAKSGGTILPIVVPKAIDASMEKEIGRICSSCERPKFLKPR